MKSYYEYLQVVNENDGCTGCPYFVPCGENAEGYTWMDEYGECPVTLDENNNVIQNQL